MGNREQTKKLTICAVGAAVSAVCVFITNIVPLSFSLLMFAALCYYIVFLKSGFMYGVVGIVASLLLTFFTGGLTILSPAFLLTAIVFAPFSILAYFIRNFYFTKVKTALIRIAIIIVFANVSLAIVWQVATWITSIDLLAIADLVGGYWVFAIIFTVLTVVFDFLFNQLSIRLVKMIK